MLSLTDAKHVITLDGDWSDKVKKDNTGYKPLEGPPVLNLDNLAYTVYSSGTTGKPKGTNLMYTDSTI